MKLSARNVLKGTVKSIVPGAVNTEVAIEVAPGVELISIISKASAEHMALKPGDTAYAVIKASNIIVGAES